MPSAARLHNDNCLPIELSAVKKKKKELLKVSS
jgi:hypothetical protein